MMNLQWTAEHRSGTELAADGLTKALQGQASRKFVELLRMMSPDMSEGDRQPKVASLKTGMCSHPAVGACLVAGVALIEQSPVVASLVVIAALIFGMVEGKVKTRPAIRPQQDPQKVKKGDTPYGFSRSGTAPRKKLAGAGILPVGQGVGELEVGVEKPSIRAFRAESSEQGHGRGYARQRCSQNCGGFLGRKPEVTQFDPTVERVQIARFWPKAW